MGQWLLAQAGPEAISQLFLPVIVTLTALGLCLYGCLTGAQTPSFLELEAKHPGSSDRKVSVNVPASIPILSSVPLLFK